MRLTEDPRDVYTRLLIICAPYGPIDYQQNVAFNAMAASGATVLQADAHADVSLTRCEMATRGAEYIRSQSRTRWVLWCDADVLIGPGVAALADYCEQASEQLGYEVSVSGTYMKRRQPDCIAACCIRKDGEYWPRRCSVAPYRTGETERIVDLIPCLVGLGCLLQPVQTFLRHVDSSPKFETGAGILSAVCQSGIEPAERWHPFVDLQHTEPLTFVGEDFDYCMTEFTMGSSVLLSPVLFDHLVSARVTPKGRVCLEGHGYATIT